MPIALHDIMWWFVASFSVPLQTEENYCENDGEWNDEFVGRFYLFFNLIEIRRINVYKFNILGFDKNM